MASDVRPLKRLRTNEEEFESYDVFISHRGPDTKSGFVGYLYEGFKSVGLRPFLDCVSIKKGQDSWTCIEHAIKSSPIAVVIFSESYAQSDWCLRELHVMLEIPGVKVLPVFYKVKPWEVRFPEKGRLANGFVKLKQRYNTTCIDKWRESLERASKLNGWECEEGDKRLEKDLVKEIVGDIFERANKPLPLDVGQYVIGVDMLAYKLIQRIDQGTSISMLGLWGMGGIGKSTLARELYNRLRTRFVACSFIEDVKDKVAIPGGIAKVQSRILKDLCGNVREEIEDKSKGKVVLEERLCMKKILVVLDDVCENDEMEYLISRKMLSDGSMCIITSRNKRLFEEAFPLEFSNEVYVHNVEGLDDEISRQVFTSHAFGGGFQMTEELKALVSCITKACGGVPLVLKVCGALLNNEKDMDVWKEVLKKLKCGSIMDEKKILQCLRVSYDALSIEQKAMFLDIACGLLGEMKDHAIRVWKSQGWSAVLGLRSLVEKALLTMDEYGCFNMHDHIRDMGRAIVKMEGRCEGGIKHLWEPESLEYIKIDETLPQLLQTLVIFEASNYTIRNSSIHLDFSNLKDLRILRCSLNPMSTLSLPKNLKWFSCIQNPFERSSASFFPIPKSSKLIILDLQGSHFETLCESIQNASKLEVMNLSSSKWLYQLPNSFGDLRSLRTLDLRKTKIGGLPETFGRLSLLETLDISLCHELGMLPNSFGDLQSLRTLDLWEAKIGGLPKTFGRLSLLETLNMSFCHELGMLPNSFGDLRSLRTLDLRRTKIGGLPETFGRLSLLETLNMSFCHELGMLPNSFGDLRSLRTLDLRRTKIGGLPETFGRLSLLETLHMSFCHELGMLPNSFGDLRSLRTLGLRGTKIGRLPETFGRLSLLETLNIS